MPSWPAPIQKIQFPSNQPAPVLSGWNQPDLRGMTLGVFWPWFRDADNEVVTVCEAMLEQLREQGARIREVCIPDLEAARVAHAITICAEMAQAMSAMYARNHHKFGYDVRINLRIAHALTALDKLRNSTFKSCLHGDSLLKANPNGYSPQHRQPMIHFHG
jgi:Asp-tRNA(Asn)/Glu-tRNA(Gln) amidotransferase A subunit family amidase